EDRHAITSLSRRGARPRQEPLPLALAQEADEEVTTAVPLAVGGDLDRASDQACRSIASPVSPTRPLAGTRSWRAAGMSLAYPSIPNGQASGCVGTGISGFA